MKRILELLILVAVVASIHALTGCVPTKGSSTPSETPEPAPHEILRRQVEQERQLRSAAESRASDAASGADFWRAAAALLGTCVCAAFIFGTAIGSKGKDHAGS